ncbi:hypothetical protein ACFL5W_00920 [Thermodesulfobacteriota bacterium]
MRDIKKYAFIIFIIISILIFSNVAFGDWYYNWSDRQDINGKEAGVFDTTPFPIDENTNSYSIENDEGVKTFNLGIKYFVDGYNGNDANSGLSIESPKKSIRAALAAAGNGNKTIIIRGSYGAFDGRYQNEGFSITGNSGESNTNRFMIVGYKQERPIIYGGNSIVFNDNGVNNFTLQRIKIQDATGRAIRSSQSDSYFLIDVWFFNNCSQCYVGGSDVGDGNVHFFGSPTNAVKNTWIYHCTSEHTYMKCYKIADNADNMLIEWSIANECGYWEGIQQTPYAHAYAYDVAAGSTAENNENAIIRYNIGGQALFGSECRYCPNFDIHHNEFYDSVKEDNYSNEDSSYSQIANFAIRGFSSYGKFHSNVVRDNDDTEKPYLFAIVAQDQAVEKIYVYNNIFYGNIESSQPIILYGYSGDGISRNILFSNNTIYGSSNQELLRATQTDADDSVIIKNNLFFQEGSGSSVAFDTEVNHSYNLYYNPNGSIGTTLDNTDILSNSVLISIPSTDFENGEANLSFPIPGDNLNSIYNTDFNGKIRTKWDIGAKEYFTAPKDFKLK